MVDVTKADIKLTQFENAVMFNAMLTLRQIDIHLAGTGHPCVKQAKDAMEDFMACYYSDGFGAPRPETQDQLKLVDPQEGWRCI